MEIPYEERLVQHAHLVNQIRSQLLDQAEKTKQDAFVAREAIIEKRTQAINKVRDSLQETTRLIQAKHESISRKINQEAIHRDANIRVNRGLQALEKFIQILRESDLTSEMLEKAIRDPIISKSVKSEARMTIASDFFKSVQKQLIMQTEFINIAAHELRTPIMPILVNTEILEEELGDKYEEIKIIARNARRLERLTENILNVARIESGTLKLDMEDFEVNKVIAAIVKDEAFRAESKHVHFIQSTDSEIHVHADRDRITQVISNLIHNALKFTDSGTIKISSEIKDDKVQIDVTDSGTGIPTEILPLLFSKFATKSDKGTGLGLYICKKIVEEHGGEMWAKNNESVGATFSFSLPLKQQ